jgi:hypothetical protein
VRILKRPNGRKRKIERVEEAWERLCEAVEQRINDAALAGACRAISRTPMAHLSPPSDESCHSDHELLLDRSREAAYNETYLSILYKAAESAEEAAAKAAGYSSWGRFQAR